MEDDENPTSGFDLRGRTAAWRAALDEHQRSVIDTFLARASVQGERAVILGRVTIGSLALLRLVLLFGDDLAAGHAKAWLVFFGIGIALMASAVTWWGMDPEGEHREVFVASVCVDLFIGVVTIYPLMYWPYEGYSGMLRAPEHGLFYLIIIASALRLSDRALLTGIFGGVAAMAVLIGLDFYLWADRITYNPGDVILVALFLGGAGVFSAALSQFTRLLVREGSLATINAERARKTLGVYVSEQVARNLDSDDAMHLGGERRPVAVLFSDLRGFTSYSEKRPPESLVYELNAYLDAMVGAIHDEGGTVDKYIGDAIMAVFGLDDDAPGHPAVGAIRAAAAMERTLIRHNESRTKRGLQPLRQGIGVHFGPAVAGNIGTYERMQYTVLGDAVNTASRLEGATKDEGIPILVSAAAVEAARSASDDRELPALERHGLLAIRGREEGLEVYRIG